ncbi:P-loop containing nucleoside triphosphate hydrolase protein [Zopfochytrium polystomum]|nr:P-loop containing nucleoside triphosphate hydrolase protein [Zopfochytrium polystomum]
MFKAFVVEGVDEPALRWWLPWRRDFTQSSDKMKPCLVRRAAVAAVSSSSPPCRTPFGLAHFGPTGTLSCTGRPLVSYAHVRRCRSSPKDTADCRGRARAVSTPRRRWISSDSNGSQPPIANSSEPVWGRNDSGTDASELVLLARIESELSQLEIDERSNSDRPSNDTQTSAEQPELQPSTTDGPGPARPKMLWSDFPDVSEKTKKCIQMHPAFRYERPTMTQVRLVETAASPETRHRDIVMRARMGTGKTVAYAVAAVEKVVRMKPPTVNKVMVLVLVPTRELAQQVYNTARALFRAHAMDAFIFTTDAKRTTLLRDIIYGGKRQLWVATPGRLLDMYQGESLIRKRLSDVRLVIVDEADRLLCNTYTDTVKILKKLNTDRQTYCITATLSEGLSKTLSRVMTQPEPPLTIDVEREMRKEVPTAGLTRLQADKPTELAENELIGLNSTRQTYVIYPISMHIAAILDALFQEAPRPVFDGTSQAFSHSQGEHHATSSFTPPKAIVFFNTWRTCQHTAALFERTPGLEVIVLHSAMDPASRARAADRFRAARSGCVLFSSDISARGMDFPDVQLIIHVGMPENVQQYVHRVGRTGRGRAVAESIRGAAATVEGATETLTAEFDEKRWWGGRSVMILAPFEAPFLTMLRKAKIPVRREVEMSMTTMNRLHRRIKAVSASIKRIGTADALENCIAYMRFYRRLPKAMEITTDILVKNATRYAVSFLGLPGLPSLSGSIVKELRLEEQSNSKPTSSKDKKAEASKPAAAGSAGTAQPPQSFLGIVSDQYEQDPQEDGGSVRSESAAPAAPPAPPTRRRRDLGDDWLAGVDETLVIADAARTDQSRPPGKAGKGAKLEGAALPRKGGKGGKGGSKGSAAQRSSSSSGGKLKGRHRP